MKYRAIWLLLLLLMLGLPSLAAEGPSPEPVVLVEWGSEESVERLARSSYKTDFFPLSNHFESQDNLLFCGLASSVMVLNALRMGKREGLPQDEQAIPKQERVWLPKGFNPFFGKYTQNNVLNDRAKQRVEVLGKPIPIGGELKPDYGLELGQLGQVLRAHALDVTVRVVDNNLGNETIKREIAANPVTGGENVIVNYARKSLGQRDGGHIPARGLRRDERFVLDHGCGSEHCALGLGRIR